MAYFSFENGGSGGGSGRDGESYGEAIESCAERLREHILLDVSAPQALAMLAMPVSKEHARTPEAVVTDVSAAFERRTGQDPEAFEKAYRASATSRQLFHGTLASAVGSIERNGLEPRVGTSTREIFSGSHDLPPAVFAAVGDRRGLVQMVETMVARVFEEVGEPDPAEWGIPSYYAISDGIFRRHAAIAVLDDTEHWLVAKPGDPDCPAQACENDRYSTRSVRPIRFMVGDEMMAFLSERGLKPSSVHDFVYADGSRDPAGR